MFKKSACVSVLLALPIAAQTPSEVPMSAIDWLSQSVAVTPIAAAVSPAIDETPIATTGTSPVVTTSTLGAISIDQIGLFAPGASELPAQLWASSRAASLVPLINAAEVETLPALQDLMIRMLLTEADPPGGAAPDGTLFLTRIDKLLDIGALDPALTMLEAAGPISPALYRRWFDVSLLIGSEDTPCAAQAVQPHLETTVPARIFCLARNGDWPAAALTLNTARALGDITAEQDALLSRFLDPELAEDADILPPPTRLSPLAFRMREAIGDGMPTAMLPRAFAHADLRNTVAWRYQMEAAERLLRTGAIPDNVLLGLYTAQRPAASGGVWDRARAMQAFDRAIMSGADAEIERRLIDAWEVMTSIRAEVPFARLYADQLFDVQLSSEAQAIAFQIMVLDGGNSSLIRALPAPTRQMRLWQAIAADTITDASALTSVEVAVIDGLIAEAAPAYIQTLIDAGKTGEATLHAMARFEQGRAGHMAGLTDGLAGLMALGLSDTARQVALEFLILKRPQ